MTNETKKIMGDDSIAVTATTVRIPTIGGHSEAVNIEFENEFDLAEVRAILEAAEGVVVQDDPKNFRLPYAPDGARQRRYLCGPHPPRRNPA